MMKKKILIALGVLSFFIVANSATAAPTYCWKADVVNAVAADSNEVTKAGASPYSFKINCTALFPKTQLFWLSTNLAESGYATLLTAISLDQPVTVLLENTSAGSLVTKIALTSSTIVEVK